MEYRNKIYLSYRYIPLTDEKIQQNMPGRFLEIPVFLGDCFIMPQPDPVCKPGEQIHSSKLFGII